MADNKRIELIKLATQLNKLVNGYPLDLITQIPTIQALSQSIVEKLNDED